MRTSIRIALSLAVTVSASLFTAAGTANADAGAAGPAGTTQLGSVTLDGTWETVSTQDVTITLPDGETVTGTRTTLVPATSGSSVASPDSACTINVTVGVPGQYVDTQGNTFAHGYASVVTTSGCPPLDWHHRLQEFQYDEWLTKSGIGLEIQPGHSESDLRSVRCDYSLKRDWRDMATDGSDELNSYLCDAS
jgi:hypothetical protein